MLSFVQWLWEKIFGNKSRLTLSGRMVPNGHILKLFYQKPLQTSVEYHSDTMIIKGTYAAIYCPSLKMNILRFLKTASEKLSTMEERCSQNY